MWPELSKTMKTCGSCRYFGFDKDGNPVDAKAAVLRIPDTHRACGYTRHFAYERPAFVIDASGFWSALCVSDDWGCNDHSPKDPIALTPEDARDTHDRETAP